MYGLEMVFEDVTEEKEWKGGGKEVKTKWGLSAEYHSTENDHEVRVEEADMEVEEKLKRQALFRKWLEKSGVN